MKILFILAGACFISAKAGLTANDLLITPDSELDRLSRVFDGKIPALTQLYDIVKDRKEIKDFIDATFEIALFDKFMQCTFDDALYKAKLQDENDSQAGVTEFLNIFKGAIAMRTDDYIRCVFSQVQQIRTVEMRTADPVVYEAKGILFDKKLDGLLLTFYRYLDYVSKLKMSTYIHNKLIFQTNLEALGNPRYEKELKTFLKKASDQLNV